MRAKRHFNALFWGYMFLNMFFPEAGRHLNEGGNCNRHNAAYHHPPEESEVAELLLYPSGHHARQHHAKGHEAGAYGIMCRAQFTLAVINEIKHIGTEAESVAKLLDAYAGTYCKKRCRLRPCQIAECGTCERYTPRHRPKPFFQTSAGCDYASDNSAYGKTDDLYLTFEKGPG